MKRPRWDAMADTGDAGVLSVYDHDRRGLVREKLKKYASAGLDASYLGCGPAKFLPLLAKQFKHVHACDPSEPALGAARAASENRDLANVSLGQADLTDPGVRLPKVDFSLAIHVLLTPDLGKRLAVWKNLSRQLTRGGHLVLVAPSLESALYVNARLVQWNLRAGIPESAAESEGFRGGEPSGEAVARGGILSAGSTLIKCFIREELITAADVLRLDAISVEKLEYRWDTEFKEPPEWMGEPMPWDWLAVFRKR